MCQLTDLNLRNKLKLSGWISKHGILTNDPGVGLHLVPVEKYINAHEEANELADRAHEA